MLKTWLCASSLIELIFNAYAVIWLLIDQIITKHHFCCETHAGRQRCQTGLEELHSNDFSLIDSLTCIYLTNWGRVTHICVSNLTIIGSDYGLSAPSHYLNQCWNFVYWTLRNKLQWNFNWNSNIFIQENAFESVVWEMAAILSRPQCVKDGREVCSLNDIKNWKQLWALLDPFSPLYLNIFLWGFQYSWYVENVISLLVLCKILSLVCYQQPMLQFFYNIWSHLTVKILQMKECEMQTVLVNSRQYLQNNLVPLLCK